MTITMCIRYEQTDTYRLHYEGGGWESRTGGPLLKLAWELAQKEKAGGWVRPYIVNATGDGATHGSELGFVTGPYASLNEAQAIEAELVQGWDHAEIRDLRRMRSREGWYV